MPPSDTSVIVSYRVNICSFSVSLLSVFPVSGFHIPLQSLHIYKGIWDMGHLVLGYEVNLVITALPGCGVIGLVWETIYDSVLGEMSGRQQAVQLLRLHCCDSAHQQPLVLCALVPVICLS